MCGWPHAQKELEVTLPGSTSCVSATGWLNKQEGSGCGRGMWGCV